MKRKFIYFFILVAYFTVGCSSEKQPKDDLPFIDSRKNYPEKEIILTDIADVTYLHLSTDNDEYLFQGGIKA